MLIHRDCVRKCKPLDVKRKILLAGVNRTVCGIIYLTNDFAGNNMVLKNINRTRNSLNVAMEKKVDTVLSCEVIRLMQLGFF